MKGKLSSVILSQPSKNNLPTARESRLEFGAGDKGESERVKVKESRSDGMKANFFPADFRELGFICISVLCYIHSKVFLEKVGVSFQ